MSGIGPAELIVLVVVGLLILGPERLPRVATQIGRWIGRARRTANQLRYQLEREITLADIEEKKKDQEKKKDPGKQPSEKSDDAAEETDETGSSSPDSIGSDDASANSDDESSHGDQSAIEPDDEAK